MALLVLKFGGTSVANQDRIQQVADLIIQMRQKGHQVVVVVSAMAGETDRLIQMARAISPTPNAREYSMLVATGEQLTISLLALTLQQKGYAAQSLTGWQAGIMTDAHHEKARIEHIQTHKLRQLLNDHIIPVVAGFQGVDDDGDVTILGRGGSDTTAVALSAALGADECRIYTDVDGVYTADPRVVPDARLLNKVRVEEMLELSSAGAKVLQTRSVEFAGKYRVPLRVLSSFTPGPGTLIVSDEETGMEQPLVSGIAFNRQEARLTLLGIPNKPSIIGFILGKISCAHINIDMIVLNGVEGVTSDFSFTVHRDEYERALSILSQISVELGARKVEGDSNIAKLSIVGVGMRSHAGIGSKMFQLLGQEGINIQLISTSEIKVSVIVDEYFLEQGVRALHKGFGLERLASPMEEFDPVALEGKG